MTPTFDPSPLHMLLVDDNRGDVLLVKESMKAAKIANELSVVGDGQAALDFLHQVPPYVGVGRPDLVLLDLNLPVVSGQQVLEAIKSDASLRSIPVVVMTSSEAESDIARSYDLRANCYVTKPFDLDRFVEVIQSIEQFWLTIVKLPPSPGWDDDGIRRSPTGSS